MKEQTQTRSVWEYSLKRERALDVNDLPVKLITPEDSANFLKLLNLNEREQEQFIVLMLDTRCQVKGYQVASMGSADGTRVTPSLVFRCAIMMGASRIIVGHNHPSSDPAPSIQDIELTNELRKTGDIVGIDLIDHLIMVDPLEADKPFFYSMRKEGQIA